MIKNFFGTIGALILLAGIFALLWFFFIYVAIIIGIVFVLFVLGVVPVEVTYKDGSVKKYKIGDVIRKLRGL